MSTKLYNGIKFKSNNIREVLDQLISIKSKAEELALQFISDRDISIFISTNNLIDKNAWEISKELTDAIDSSSYNKYRFTPRVTFSVVIYPTTEGDIYGYYFDSDRKQYLELIEPFYTDFHYQNQSDPPSDIPYEEWQSRGDKWDELLKDKFKDTGLTYGIVSGDDIDIWDLEDKIKSVLEKLKRENKIDSVL